MYKRRLKLTDIKTDSLFLWGARQTGKSTLLRTLFPDVEFYDLLKSDEYERLSRRPALLREELSEIPGGSIVIIDEVQKIPQLLDEVHWLIENRDLRFILSGSSARKIKRLGANLLGGRALSYVLHPLVSAEVPGFDIVHAVRTGMLPRHYLAGNPLKRLQSYVGDYLQEEIRAEALVRNVTLFSRFLEVAAISSGEIINYHNIATDCGISGPTVKEYFSMLEDTHIGYMIPAYTKAVKRRLIQAPKFYFFDVGIVNYLLKRNNVQQGSPEFGKSFEHLIVQEIVAYLDYSGSNEKLTYWRSASQFEVDCIIGNARVAIEIKSSAEVHSHHIRGLRAFREEHPASRAIVVSFDKKSRMTDGIEIIPATTFLKKLWNGEIDK